MTTLLHFRTVNVCLLYDGAEREKRNSCWCLFELWPNPTLNGHVGAPSAPNPSSSCTPSQTHTHTHSTPSAPLSLSHTQVSVHLRHIKVCLCFHAPFQVLPGQVFPSLSHRHTHTPSGGWGASVSRLPEALALITCSSESLGLTL